MPGWLNWSTMREEARTRLWPLPVLALVIALNLGIGLPLLDAALEDQLPPSVSVYLFGGGAGAARTVLSAIATSLITVTSLTFSLTVVTLQLASSQYSPRLLRTFTRDRFVHSTLALFLGSFVYALTVLRTVRTPQENREAFVPHLSVTVAFILALASVLGLVLFLAHLAREIRVETILRNVHEDATGTIESVLPERHAGVPASQPNRPDEQDVTLLLAPSSGFLVGIDTERLRQAALNANAVVLINRPVGDAVVKGTPIGCAWPIARGGGQLSSDRLARLRKILPRALDTGFERTAGQDVAFGLRQLTDVAVKALSPGINDPTTSVHALNHSAALLCDLLDKELRPHILDDEEGRPRVVLEQRSFAELLELAVAQPRIYGDDDPFVMRALLALLQAVAWVAEQPEETAAINAQLYRVRDAIDHGHLDSVHRHELATLARAVADALVRTKG